ncbi:unnamed protein product [Nesidiocoris tenuis]|uniref:Uncharacterized protein n=1 Tax=Nesidiocoris tenuis TaxID=355587 RepID=A0A6H5GIU8_9HEMI|nr:unnamed protein product [Nesidiocoris tenuis]
MKSKSNSYSSSNSNKNSFLQSNAKSNARNLGSHTHSLPEECRENDMVNGCPADPAYLIVWPASITACGAYSPFPKHWPQPKCLEGKAGGEIGMTGWEGGEHPSPDLPPAQRPQATISLIFRSADYPSGTAHQLPTLRLPISVKRNSDFGEWEISTNDTVPSCIMKLLYVEAVLNEYVTRGYESCGWLVFGASVGLWCSYWCAPCEETVYLRLGEAGRVSTWSPWRRIPCANIVAISRLSHNPCPTDSALNVSAAYLTPNESFFAF